MKSLKPRIDLSSHRASRLQTLVVAIVVATLAWGCSSDRVIAPSGPKVSVCHFDRSVGSIAEIFSSELPDHKKHGDYVAQLDVDKSATAGDSIHFRRMTDALAVARAVRIARNETEKAACRITIVAASGVMPGSTSPSSDPAFELFPLIIDVPDITLRGALKMQVDASGRATGVGVANEETTFAPSPALIVIGGGGNSQVAPSEPIIIVNGHPDGPKGHGAVIEGFVFQSGRGPTQTPVGGQAVFTMRVRDLVIAGNRLEGGFTESIDLRASSGILARNHLSGNGGACDICLAGPGEFTVKDNRLLGAGGVPGVLSVPTTILPVHPAVEQYVLPAAATVTAVIANNEVRGHLSKPVGAGLRAGAVGIGAPNVIGTSKVTMTGNNLVGNTFGIIIEAAFPVTGTALRGDIELTTSGNTISESCQNDVLVTLSRHATGLGLLNQFPSFLRNSTYNLTLGADIPWDKAWFAHPAGFGNTLIVNGQPVPNGSNTAYVASRTCP